MHYLLTYHYTDDYLERRGTYRDQHLRLGWEAHERGQLLLGGTVGAPAHSAVLVFVCDSAQTVEDFVQADYFQHGLVCSHTIQPWSTVLGATTTRRCTRPSRPEGYWGPPQSASIKRAHGARSNKVCDAFDAETLVSALRALFARYSPAWLSRARSAGGRRCPRTSTPAARRRCRPRASRPECGHRPARPRHPRWRARRAHMGVEFVAAIGVDPALVGVVRHAARLQVHADFGIDPEAGQQGRQCDGVGTRLQATDCRKWQ